MTGNFEAKRGLDILISAALRFVEEPAEKGQKAQARPEQGRGYLNKTQKAEHLRVTSGPHRTAQRVRSSTSPHSINN